MILYGTCKCQLTSGHLLGCPMSSATSNAFTADYSVLKAQLAAERHRAEVAEMTYREALILWTEEGRATDARIERLEAALREIQETTLPIPVEAGPAFELWFRVSGIAQDALALNSTRTTERHPNCYGEGCPWCIAHDSIRMAEPGCRRFLVPGSGRDARKAFRGTGRPVSPHARNGRTEGGAVSELLPCPFCGEAPSGPGDDNGLWGVSCYRCEFTGPCAGEHGWNESRERAVAAWNRRSPDPISPAEPRDK